MPRQTFLATLLAIVLSSSVVAAQSRAPFVEATGQFTTISSSQFTTSLGVGGRFAFLPTSWLGADAEMTFYPDGLKAKGSDWAFSRRRVEGLFGVSVGPTLGRVRPFGTFRPGFVRFEATTQPLLCMTAPPAPLTCLMENGDTRYAMEIGGGIDVYAGGHALLRASAGDRMVRYPASREPDGTPHTSPFYGHELRVSVGAGVRF